MRNVGRLKSYPNIARTYKETTNETSIYMSNKFVATHLGL